MSFLQFQYNKETTDTIKALQGKWSKDHNCRYVQKSKPLLERIVKALAEKKCISIERPETTAMLRLLQLKGYSSNTNKIYKNAFSLYLDRFYPRMADTISKQEIEDYLLYLAQEKNYSESAINTTINAIKFYYEQALKKEKEFYALPRPKKAEQLPKVRGEKELGRLFNAISYKKHKCILFTAYSAGLRVSEVVHLQLKHIDADRMQIFVERSKGKKDRYVGLSPILLDVLRAYIKECKPRPVKYLFEGAEAGSPYHARSAQRVFQTAKERAGIKKAVSFHSLRHSFVTHLLEKGIDIRYIKELLGHFNIATTERYLHVKKEQLVQIESPLDSLWLNGSLKL